MDERNYSVPIKVYLQISACGHNGPPQVLLPGFYPVLFLKHFKSLSITLDIFSCQI